MNNPKFWFSTPYLPAKKRRARRLTKKGGQSRTTFSSVQSLKGQSPKLPGPKLSMMLRAYLV